MTAYLVHHADAVGPHVDSQRPLSTAGHAQAEQIAAAIHARGFRPAAIWHSGKLRARQTAETCWRIVHPFAEFKMVRGLRSEDPPQIVRDALLGESRDLLLVGHMPHLPALLSLLTRTSQEFPLHGAVALESKDGSGIWTEIWRSTGEKSA